MRARIVRAAAVAVLAAVLSGAAAAYVFNDPQGRFTATFPAEPSLDRQEGSSVSGPHVHYTWEVDLEKRHFSITYTEYAVAPVKNYDKNIMGLLAATKGTLMRQVKIDLDGVDGRETFTQLPENAVLRQRLFQVGNRLYQAVYAGPFGTELRPDVEAFMQSFKFVK